MYKGYKPIVGLVNPKKSEHDLILPAMIKMVLQQHCTTKEASLWQ